MGRKNKRIHGPLLVVCLALCIIAGGVFTSSSYMPTDLQDSWSVAGIPQEAGDIGLLAQLFGTSKERKAEVEVATEPETELATWDESGTETETQAPPAQKKKKKSSFEVSPEAKEGVWTSSGTDWVFMTENGTVPYSGWLHDVDGKTYYLGDDYLMVTGWQEIGEKRYYFDPDGILQTGKVSIDGEEYVFDQDGSLVSGPDEAVKEKKEEKDKADEEAAVAGEEAEKTAALEGAAEPLKKGALALTFDDGPSDFTPDLLGALAAKGAHGTFFLVGDEIMTRQELPSLMLSLGMEVGNHTFSHKDLTKLTAAQISETVGGVDQLLLDLTGQGASVVRPPYGA